MRSGIGLCIMQLPLLEDRREIDRTGCKLLLKLPVGDDRSRKLSSSVLITASDTECWHTLRVEFDVKLERYGQRKNWEEKHCAVICGSCNML